MSRHPYCSVCRELKEPGRKNESCCKKCKSDRRKRIGAIKRAEKGLPPLGVKIFKPCKIEGCMKEMMAMQLCSKHYQQVKLHGNAFVSRKEKDNSSIVGFFNNCEIITESGCWIWAKYIDKDGYGEFSHKGINKRAHRWSYELYKGMIPHNMQVCHKCDIPYCVNPDHLFLGNLRDNMLDRDNKNRQAKGSRVKNSKLNEAQVLSIRKQLDLGATLQSLADLYNVKILTISRIKRRITWKHVI